MPQRRQRLQQLADVGPAGAPQEHFFASLRARGMCWSRPLSGSTVSGSSAWVMTARTAWARDLRPLVPKAFGIGGGAVSTNVDIEFQLALRLDGLGGLVLRTQVADVPLFFLGPPLGVEVDETLRDRLLG